MRFRRVRGLDKHRSAPSATKIAQMTKSLRALVLLTVLLWQSFAVLGDFGISARASAPDYPTLHATDPDIPPPVSHSSQVEVDEGIAQQPYSDTTTGGGDLLASVWENPLDSQSASRPAFCVALLQSLTLESPLRPPQHIA